MKRLFLSVITALCLSTVCFSQEKLEVTDWNMEMHLSDLARYLDLNSIQYEHVADAIDFFSDKMKSAKYSMGERQIKYLNEAVYGNLKLMKSTLSQDQYKKYLRILNSQLRNKGLNPYIKSTSEFLAQNKIIKY
ncbi:MAG: hypothetical protein IJW56_08600 [Bacteroides sp.]|nr:hypothetical protein [Bacteroides sp.]